jgi:hypothetical protein
MKSSHQKEHSHKLLRRTQLTPDEHLSPSGNHHHTFHITYRLSLREFPFPKLRLHPETLAVADPARFGLETSHEKLHTIHD